MRGRIFDGAIPKNLSPDETREIYNSLNEVLQKIHSVDLKKAGLEDYGKPGLSLLLNYGILCLLFSKNKPKCHLTFIYL